jgi:hypothetical protein
MLGVVSGMTNRNSRLRTDKPSHKWFLGGHDFSRAGQARK